MGDGRIWGRPNKVLNGCYRVLVLDTVQDLPNRYPLYQALPSKVSAMASGTGGSNVFADPGHDLVEP